MTSTSKATVFRQVYLAEEHSEQDESCLEDPSKNLSVIMTLLLALIIASCVRNEPHKFEMLNNKNNFHPQWNYF
jgi:hypothetical protein